MRAQKSLPLAGLLVIHLLVAGLVPARSGAKPTKRRTPVAQPAPRGVVNINTASTEQLQLLPGIGASKADAIIRYRQRRKFRATHDLIRVRGIGRKTYRRLKPNLIVKGPTTLQPTAKKVRKSKRKGS